MDIQIINKPFHVNIYGFSGTALKKDYTETAFKLMDKMWQVVKSSQLENEGKNIWVFEKDDHVFAGVEMKTEPSNSVLEQRNILIDRYAWYKHAGPYSLIKEAGTRMREELKKRGIITILPYLEIYGHWSNDESKLETELIMALA